MADIGLYIMPKDSFLIFFISFSVITFVSLKSGSTVVYLLLKLIIGIVLSCRFAISFRDYGYCPQIWQPYLRCDSNIEK